MTSDVTAPAATAMDPGLHFATVEDLVAALGEDHTVSGMLRYKGLTDEIVQESTLSPHELAALFTAFSSDGSRNEKLVIEAFLNGRLPGAVLTFKSFHVLQLELPLLASAVKDLSAAAAASRDPSGLTAEEAAFLNANGAALLDVMQVILSPNRLPKERVATTLRSIRRHGLEVTKEYRPTVLDLEVDGVPLGAEGARFVREAMPMLRERGWRVDVVELPTVRDGLLSIACLVKLHRGGLSPAAAVALLDRFNFQEGRAVEAVQNGIASPVADGWL